jgi:hypothetical protein
VTAAAAITILALPARAAAAQEHPLPVPPPQATPPTEPAAADAELVRLLTTIFNPWSTPDQRRSAVAQSALADPRAIAPLTFLLGDFDSQVRAAAAAALGRFSDRVPVETALIFHLQRRFEDPTVRIAAALSLGQRGGNAAGEALYQLYTDDGEALPLRQAARMALAARFPALLQLRGAAEVVDRQGRLLLALGSAALGSYALGAVGGLGQNEAGVTIGILGGALVGAGAAYFLTRTGEITNAQAGWTVSGGLWGAGLGMLAAGAVEADPSTRLILSLGLIGEAIGFGATLGTRKKIPFQGGDVATIDLGGLLAMDLALGGLMLSEGGDSQAGMGILLGSAAVGLAGAAAITRKLRFSGGDIPLTLDGAVEGATIGALLPLAVNSADDVLAGGVLGLGFGLGIGAGLAQVTDYSPGAVGAIFVVGAYGKLLGLSLPLLADASDEAIATGAITGSLAALTAAHLLVPRLTYKDGAAGLVIFGTALGLWHGIALGESASSLTDQQQTGAWLLGAGLGGIAAMSLSQRIELRATENLALAGGVFWGTWFSAWGGALADLDNPTMLRLTLGAGDVGLAIAALAVSPVLGVDARRIGIANLAGLAGAGIASLGAALATPDSDAVIAANLVGSAVGLVGGAILAVSLDLSPVSTRAPPPPPDSASGWRRMLARIPTPQLAPLVLPPDQRRTGASAPAFGVGLTFVEQAR